MVEDILGRKNVFSWSPFLPSIASVFLKIIRCKKKNHQEFQRKDARETDLHHLVGLDRKYQKGDGNEAAGGSVLYSSVEMSPLVAPRKCYCLILLVAPPQCYCVIQHGMEVDCVLELHSAVISFFASTVFLSTLPQDAALQLRMKTVFVTQHSRNNWHPNS